MKNTIFATTNPLVTEREERHAALVRKLAGECVVLLENDGVLPLKEKGPVALFGNGARNTVKGGTGSGDVNSRSSVNIEEGLESTGFTVVTKDWLARNEQARLQAQAEYGAWVREESRRQGIPEISVMFSQPFTEPDVEPLSAEDISSANTGTAIYVISRNSGEGADRRAAEGDYLPSRNELDNLRRLAESYEGLVLVLNIGGVMELTEIREIKGIRAIVLMSQLGNQGGNILADVLTGAVTPSGRLTDTWAKDYLDHPSSAEFSHNNGNVHDDWYRDGIYVGYRYFDSFGVKPLYPFGYGLSYTEFSTTVQSVVQEGGEIKIAVLVRNQGETYSGKEVVQVYVSAPSGKMDRPHQELKAFGKTRCLAPGEEDLLTLAFPLASLAAYCQESSRWMLEPGDYIVRVGRSSADTVAAAVLHLAQAVTTEVCTPIQPLDCQMEDIRAAIPNSREETPWELTMDLTLIPRREHRYPDTREEYASRQNESLTMEDVLTGRCSVEELTAQLTVRELAELCVGTQRSEDNSIVGAASYCVPGAAGDTSSVIKESRHFKNLILADGPAGLRLQPHFKTDCEGKVLPGGEVFGMSVTPFETVPEGAVDYYQYCTAIPIGWALAQSWNCTLVEELGEMIGREMEEFGVDLWLAPALNIHRNPLCGRNFEYFSEDPLISGKIAAAITRGVQRVPGKGTTIKHFAANNQEENRYFTNAHISERALREIYLKGFEIAVEESQPMSIMTSYNLVNGVHTANSRDLLQKVARDEWGFKGVIMTDWYTSQDVPSFTGKYEAQYPISASTGCIWAGNDLQMPGCQKNVDDIVKAVTAGETVDGHKITLADLQFNAANVLRVVARVMSRQDTPSV